MRLLFSSITAAFTVVEPTSMPKSFTVIYPPSPPHKRRAGFNTFYEKIISYNAEIFQIYEHTIFVKIKLKIIYPPCIFLWWQARRGYGARINFYLKRCEPFRKARRRYILDARLRLYVRLICLWKSVKPRRGPWKTFPLYNSPRLSLFRQYSPT